MYFYLLLLLPLISYFVPACCVAVIISCFENGVRNWKQKRWWGGWDFSEVTEASAVITGRNVPRLQQGLWHVQWTLPNADPGQKSARVSSPNLAPLSTWVLIPLPPGKGRPQLKAKESFLLAFALPKARLHGFALVVFFPYLLSWELSPGRCHSLQQTHTPCTPLSCSKPDHPDYWFSPFLGRTPLKNLVKTCKFSLPWKMSLQSVCRVCL